jgi:putative sterol carrier protein
VEDIIRRFFEDLPGPQPEIPKTIKGTLRFDLQDGKQAEHWLLTFDKGKVSVAESDAAADCIMSTDKATLEAIIEGRMNAMAALLRGVISVEGRSLLMAVFRMMLPAPVAVPRDLVEAGYARRRS